MPLTREQLELLTDLHDGQCTPAQRAQAATLAATPEGAACLRDLTALRTLVRTHAATRAPLGLKSRVLANLDEDFDDISRPTASILPLRRVFMLAAACLALTLGLYIATSAFTPTAPAVAPQSIADITDVPAASPPTTAGKEEVTDTQKYQPVAGGGGGDPANEREKSPPLQPTEPPAGPYKSTNATTVLNMDRGADDHQQLSIELERGRGINTLQAYNELLSVVCLHGETKLMEGQSAQASESTNNDFTAFDGLEVELPQDAVPALLSALHRVTSGQAMGALQVPEDLQQPMDDTETLLVELAEARHELRGENTWDDAGQDKTRNNITGKGMQGLLPPSVQVERLRAQGAVADAIPEFEGMARTKRPDGKGSSPGLGQERKVKLYIRLQ